MTTESPKTAPTTESAVPTNTRVLGVETGTYTPPGLKSAELPLPGKEPPAVVKAEENAEVPAAVTEATTADNEETKTEESAAEGEQTEGDATEEAAEDAGIDLDALGAEFEANDGKLTDESYDKLEQLLGLDRGTVDSIASAMKERADRNAARWDDMMGGKENKEAIIAWARENWTTEQRAAYNAALDSKNAAQIDLAIQGLASAAREAGVALTPVVTADSSVLNLGAPEASSPYQSQEEYREAIRSPKYKKDPAYRATVQAKLRASSFFKAGRA